LQVALDNAEAARASVEARLSGEAEEAKVRLLPRVWWLGWLNRSLACEWHRCAAAEEAAPHARKRPAQQQGWA